MANKHKRSLVKGLSFIDFGRDGNSSVVDVNKGKIVRIRPLHYDWQYDKKDLNPWKMDVRGHVLEPTMKTLLPPFALGYKKRVYSPNRVLYPLKRFDWDPDGERNVQNRGKSKYVRISWNEAVDLVASELKRMNKKYGPAANLIPDIAENTQLLLFWGCDPETTPWGFNGQMASRVCYWYTELGIKCIYICPDLNYGAAVHADKWIPIKPGTDAALQLAIAHVWITEGTYDKAYVATHTYGFDKFEEYVTGKEDGIPKTADWAAEITGIPAISIKALAREWASKRTSIAHGNGGPTVRGPYSTEPARLEVLLLAMQGLGKPGVHQLNMIEWGLYGQGPMPAEGK